MENGQSTTRYLLFINLNYKKDFLNLIIYIKTAQKNITALLREKSIKQFYNLQYL